MIAIDKQHADDVLEALRDAEAAANKRFIEAARSGEKAQVDAFLKQGVDINTTDAVCPFSQVFLDGICDLLEWLHCAPLGRDRGP